MTLLDWFLQFLEVTAQSSLNNTSYRTYYQKDVRKLKNEVIHKTTID